MEFHSCVNKKIIHKENVCGSFLGEGAEGEVFVFKNNIFNKNKKYIIKIMYDDGSDIENILKFLIKHPSKNIVNIVDYGFANDDYNLKYMYYISEKLNKRISNSEGLILDRIVNPNGDIDEYSKCMAAGLLTHKKINEKFYKFIFELTQNERFGFTDIHEENIMKDSYGNYKLIDLGCIHDRRNNRT